MKVIVNIFVKEICKDVGVKVTAMKRKCYWKNSKSLLLFQSNTFSFTSFVQHEYSMLDCPSFPMVRNQQGSYGKPPRQRFVAKACWTSSINEGSTTNEICWNYKHIL